MAGYASDDEAAVSEPTLLRLRAPPNAARAARLSILTALVGLCALAAGRASALSATTVDACPPGTIAVSRSTRLEDDVRPWTALLGLASSSTVASELKCTPNR